MIFGKKGEKTKLSVIVASQASATDLENCLEAILKSSENLKISKRSAGRIEPSGEADGDGFPVEIIVADCCLHENTARWIKQYPAVFFFEFPPQTPLPALLGAAIERANGEIIAFTDSTSLVSENWIEAIVLAHAATDAPVIGGAVKMSASGSLTDWAAYFCDYGEFMPTAPRGAAAVVPGNNFSVKRPVLKKAAELVAPEFWKTLWCRQLQSEGFELFSEPSILIRWLKKYRLKDFLARRYRQGRCFAARRFAGEKFSKRAAYAAGTVLLPFVFLLRTTTPVLKSRRFFGKFLLSFPVIALGVTLWSFGETVGFLAGAGKSCRRID